MRALLALGAGAIALALVWMLASTDGAADASVTPETIEPAGAVDEPGPSDLAPPVAIADDGPVPVREEPALSEAAPELVEPIEIEDAATLELSVIAKETAQPVVGAQVFMRAHDNANPEAPARWLGTDPEQETSPTTDDAGRARFELVPEIEYELWVTLSERGAFANQKVEPCAPNERRRLTIELTTEADRDLFGRVVALEDGAPIAGARVRYQTPQTSMAPGSIQRTTQRTLDETRTDADGFFEKPFQSWRHPHGRVDAEGFGSTFFALKNGHEAADEALLIELERGAILRGHVVSESGALGFTVHASASGHQLLAGGEQTMYYVGRLAMETEVGADGTWELTEVPPHADLTLELRHDNEVLRREGERLRLAPGEERRFEWQLGAGATIVGRATIAGSGEPLAQHAMWLVSGSEGRFLQAYSSPVAKTATDASGGFTFADVAPGDWHVGPAPGLQPWEVAKGDEVAPFATTVTVPGGATTVELELEVHRGLFIRGEVLGPGGERAENSYVWGQSNEAGVWSNAQARDGTFALGPLVPGQYQLTGNGSTHGVSSSVPLEVEAGTEGVVLRLRPGGSIRGTVIEVATGEGIQAEVRLRPDDQTEFGWTASFSQPDGNFEFTGVAPGGYSVSAQIGDIVGEVRGLAIAPNDALRDIEIDLIPGATLVVKCAGECAGVSYRVTRNGNVEHNGSLNAQGTARATLLPGSVTVSASLPDPAGGERTNVEREALLESGKETFVELSGE